MFCVTFTTTTVVRKMLMLTSIDRLLRLFTLESITEFSQQVIDLCFIPPHPSSPLLRLGTCISETFHTQKKNSVVCVCVITIIESDWWGARA